MPAARLPGSLGNGTQVSLWARQTRAPWLENHLCVVTSGMVLANYESEPGSRLAEVLVPGDVVAEGICGGQAPSGFTTITSATLVVHDTKSVDDLLVRGGSSADWLLRGMSIRVGRSENRQANLMRTDMRARLSRLLLDWCAVGATTHVPGPFRGGLAQSVLAEVIGSTRHTVNRTLRNFEHRGFVVLEHGGITVEDFDAVTRLAREAKPYFTGVELHSQDAGPYQRHSA